MHTLKKRSDGGATRVRDHHCGRESWLCVGGNEATRGSGEQKVTHALKKRSDGGVARVRDHHCAGGT
jgi:hypothetical protein